MCSALSVPAANTSPTGNPSFVAFSGSPDSRSASLSLSMGDATLIPRWVPQTWFISQQDLKPDTLDDLVFIVKYTVAIADNGAGE